MLNCTCADHAGAVLGLDGVLLLGDPASDHSQRRVPVPARVGLLGARRGVGPPPRLMGRLRTGAIFRFTGMP